MISTTLRRALARSTLTALALLAPSRVFAGPPLICHPYDIGVAQSLPADPLSSPNSTYDRTHLVADTLALLAPEAPILVRMETLRRAAIYTTGNLRVWKGEKYTRADQELAATLIAKLRERTTVANANARAHALFDLGFFAETLRQTELDPALDGYPLIVKAAESLPNNPDVEFALALASAAAVRADHIAKARALAQPGSLVASNLQSHFGKS